MIFSSTIFIFLFLPAVLILTSLLPGKYIKAKNGVLLAFSLLFYAWGEPRNILLMLLSIVVNYFLGLALGKCEGNNRARRQLLVLTVVFNLGLLFFFKYFNFVTGGVFPHIALPIGISFFTFQIMSYTLDVYMHNCAPQRNIFTLALYLSLFPQLIAGPIVRYVDVERELTERRTTLEGMGRGIVRFAYGFAKKVIISNTVAVIADTIFKIDMGLPAVTAWAGIICYALQIYYDFSGYSDMAIGIGHMLGFNFLENFDYPYISTSVKEFWRRWHISLSSWFRDYLYIPLGGNRRGVGRTYINLLIVFFCTGLWHGASFNFIVWGLFHGFFLVIERMGFGKILAKLPKAVGWLYTMLVVLVGWVFFRADTLPAAFRYLGSMFSFNGGLANAAAQFTNLSFFITIIAVVLSAPVYRMITAKAGKTELGATICYAVEVVLAIALVLTSIIFLTGSDYNPFIYFRF